MAIALIYTNNVLPLNEALQKRNKEKDGNTISDVLCTLLTLMRLPVKGLKTYADG